MNMKEINQVTEDIYNQKMAKREAENTVLDGCAEDLSDVSFNLGKPSMDIALVKIGVVLLAVFGGRLIWRRLPVELIWGGNSNSSSVLPDTFGRQKSEDFGETENSLLQEQKL